MRLEDVARIRARSDEFVDVPVTGIDAVVPEQYLQVLGGQYRALTPSCCRRRWSAWRRADG